MTPLGWLGHKASTLTNNGMSAWDKEAFGDVWICSDQVAWICKLSQFFAAECVCGWHPCLLSDNVLSFLTFVILNKCKMSHPLLIVSRSDYLIQVVNKNSQTEWQTVQILISWPLHQLIRIYTVCKSGMNLVSVGPGLRYLFLSYSLSSKRQFRYWCWFC